MKIIEIHGYLDAVLTRSVETVPRGTVLGILTGKIRQMAAAYESDGLRFLASGDNVNALASFWYALGWLHFGYAYGLFTGPQTLTCPVPGSGERLPREDSAALNEKTRRYMRLLRTARASVASSPERGTPTGEFPDRILFIAGIFEQQGGRYLATGREEDALACFSYGHGWLDAAVTSGLFRIMAERDLFTV